MLTVDHVVRPSAIHGLGVFTSEYIKKGQIVWRFNPIVDHEISIEDLAALPESAVGRICRHAEFVESRMTFILCSDGDYYMNHADDPSLIDDGTVMIAARDLHPGCELTCDYRVVRVLDFHPENMNKERLDAISRLAARQINSSHFTSAVNGKFTKKLLLDSKPEIRQPPNQ